MKKTRRIGLALSGGGYRAAAFHTGVLGKLEELGIRSRLDVVSCVSGGAIVGAFCALDWSTFPADLLRHFLKNHSLLSNSFLGGMLNPFKSRTEMLAEGYDEHLFKHRTLGDLKSCPRTYINATNMANGKLFMFVSGGGGKSEMGDYDLELREAPNFKLSLAAAASSAYPPIFPPLVLETDVYPVPKPYEYVSLADGGIYDNLGVNPLVNKLNKLDFIILSDGGMPFSSIASPAESGSGALKDSLDVMMEQVRSLQFERLKYMHLAGGPKPIWFSIDSRAGEAIPGDAVRAASVPTGLSQLDSNTTELLVRHGAALAEARIKQYGGELLE